VNEQRCREVLEVGEEASLDEITQAYQRLKRMHGLEPNSYAAPFMDEFAPELRSHVLAEIEEAYRELMARQAPVKPAVQPKPGGVVLERPLDGAKLRAAREAAGFSLEEVAAESHVRQEFLVALETERFRELPAGAVYVRGYLTSYLRVIQSASDEAVQEYMARYQKAMGR
jgi:DNA-binding XRE family transcriptional regulator